MPDLRVRRPAKLRPASGFMSAIFNVDGGRLPFPKDEAFLSQDAGTSLMRANIQIMDAGGRLIITDMWRTPQAQLMAWTNWNIGKKSTYSPPPGASMHEVGRAVDLDLRPESTKIPPEQVIALLHANGWASIAEHGQPGSWHWEFRGKFLQQTKEAHGYEAMVSLAMEIVKYEPTIDIGIKDKDLRKGHTSQKHWL